MSVYFYILLIVKSWHCSITSKDFSTIEKTSPLVLRQLKLKTWKKYFFVVVRSPVLRIPLFDAPPSYLHNEFHL